MNIRKYFVFDTRDEKSEETPSAIITPPPESYYQYEVSKPENQQYRHDDKFIKYV